MNSNNLKTLSNALYRGWVGQCIDLASLSIVVFEWTITLHLEVTLVWKSKWSLAKVTFLLSRYLPIADFILKYTYQHEFAIGTCRELLYAMGAVYLAGLYLADYILVLQTCAVWNMNKKIIAGLASYYVGSLVYTAYNYFHMIATLEFLPSTLLGECLAVPKGILYTNYVVLAAYDAGMLALMLYPTIREYTVSQGDIILRSQLMRTVYTEGTLFYAYLLLLSITTITVVVQVPDNMFLFLLTSRMIRAVFACRVLLHIRELSVQRQYGPSFGMDSSRLSGLRFA